MPSAAILDDRQKISIPGNGYNGRVRNNGGAAASASPLQRRCPGSLASLRYRPGNALDEMERSLINPFDASKILADEKGVFAESATLIRRSFLYRTIDFELPFHGQLVYDGWWFWQRVTIDGIRVWSQISWLRLERVIQFLLPPSLNSQGQACRIDIQFGPGLLIRRFQVTVAGVVAYDEIT